jgi:hypothetical protein
MTPLDEFLPYVLPDVPGCADVQALGAISSAAIEFCERSLVLQREHDPISVRANVGDYDLSPPSHHLVCKVMKAWYRNRVLVPYAPDDMDDPGTYNPAHSTGGSTPIGYIQKDERTITLCRAPGADEANAVTLRVALKPTRHATSVDDALFEDWVEVIAAGAKSSLQIVPGKTFSNPQMAAFNQGAFIAGINVAMVKANKGHTRANLSVRMRRL